MNSFGSAEPSSVDRITLRSLDDPARSVFACATSVEVTTGQFQITWEGRMRRAVILLAGCGLFTHSKPLLAQSSSSCEAILKDGVFTVNTVKTDTATFEVYTSWLCSTDFKTHEEARRYGVGAALPVYGVPVQATGTFSDAVKQAWFNTHCKSTRNVSQFSHRLEQLETAVAGPIVDAWRACVEMNTEQKGLRCALSGKGETLTLGVRFYPLSATDGEPALSQPIQLKGMTCEGLPGVGSKIPFGGAKYICTRKADAANGSLPDATISINTSAGTCAHEAPAVGGDERVVSGTEEITGYTIWRYPKVRFLPGSRVIVRHGASFVIDAGEIVAGAGASIDGTGDSGPQGAGGANGCGGNSPPQPHGSPPCRWKAKKQNEYQSANSDCNSNQSHFDNGRAGGNGADGGPGSVIVVRSKKPMVGSLTCKKDGGPGGPGGQGGAGAIHEAPNGDSYQCRKGVSGVAGAKGRDGVCDIM